MTLNDDSTSYSKAFFNHLLHAVPAHSAFLRKEMPYYLLKPPMLFRGVWHSKCPKCEKMKGKNPQLCPFTRFFCHFWLYRMHALIF